MPRKRKPETAVGKAPAKKAKSSKTTAIDASDKKGGGDSIDLASLIKEPGWKNALTEEFSKDYFKSLEKQLAERYTAGDQIFPPKDLIFNAFNTTALSKIKAVILGQDPYHDDGQAMGMSFSVPKGIKVPPSLKNIYKELEQDKKIKNFKTPDHGDLQGWAEQGIFLLNTTLTVKAHEPNSHAKLGWQKFTDKVIEVISKNCNGIVFILWGNFAHKKEKLIDGTKHTVIKTAHPSPLSVKKFMGCKCFSDADKALKIFGKSPIHWCL